jgi:hypothetical protein
MTAVAAVSSVQQLIHSSNDTYVVRIPKHRSSLTLFNEVLITETIAHSLPQPTKARIKVDPWDLSLGQLVGADNSLALAKLRLEIERELRRIAYNDNINVGTRPVGAMALARELASKKVLPPELLNVLQQIIPIANEAVHGGEISDQEAASVVRAGGQLLEALRSLREFRGNISSYEE